MTAGAGVNVPPGLPVSATVTAVSDPAPSIRLHHLRWGSAAVYGRRRRGRAAGGRGTFMPASGRESCTAGADFGVTVGLCCPRRRTRNVLRVQQGRPGSTHRFRLFGPVQRGVPRCSAAATAWQPCRLVARGAAGQRGPDRDGHIACAPDASLEPVLHNSIRAMVVDLQDCTSADSAGRSNAKPVSRHTAIDDIDWLKDMVRGFDQ